MISKHKMMQLLIRAKKAKKQINDYLNYGPKHKKNNKQIHFTAITLTGTFSYTLAFN